MLQANFVKLGLDACHELNPTDISAFLEKGTIVVDGASVTLEFDEQPNGDCLNIHVRLPQTTQLMDDPMALRSLLALNLLTGSKTLGAFAVDPQDGQAVFVAQLNELDQLDGKSLAARLRVFAAQGMAGLEAVRDHVA
jgi:hypothetical protein